MRVTRAFLLLLAVCLVGAGESAVSGQTDNPELPFTLTASVNARNPSQDDRGDKTVRVGSGVTVRIRKTNTTDQEIPKLGPENGPSGYNFDVRDENGNLIAQQNPTTQWAKGGGPAPVLGTKDLVLQPGESKIDYMPLSRWYDLSKPGRYTIQVSERVSNVPGSAVVKSNTVTITITQ
jgi:hypothetical protein